MASSTLLSKLLPRTFLAKLEDKSRQMLLNLPPEHKHQLHFAFDTVDSNHDGVVSLSELKAFCKSANLPLTSLTHLFKSCDINKDGLLDYDECLPLLFALGVFALPTCHLCDELILEKYFYRCKECTKSGHEFTLCSTCYKSEVPGIHPHSKFSVENTLSADLHKSPLLHERADTIKKCCCCGLQHSREAKGVLGTQFPHVIWVDGNWYCEFCVVVFCGVCGEQHLATSTGTPGQWSRLFVCRECSTLTQSAHMLQSTHHPQVNPSRSTHQTSETTSNHLTRGSRSNHQSPQLTSNHLTGESRSNHQSPWSTSNHLTPESRSNLLAPESTSNHVARESRSNHQSPGSTSNHLTPESRSNHVARESRSHHQSPESTYNHLTPESSCIQQSPGSTSTPAAGEPTQKLCVLDSNSVVQKVASSCTCKTCAFVAKYGVMAADSLADNPYVDLVQLSDMLRLRRILPQSGMLPGTQQTASVFMAPLQSVVDMVGRQFRLKYGSVGPQLQQLVLFCAVIAFAGSFIGSMIVRGLDSLFQ